jgi:nucleoside-diphosphate-sugar epimerase
LLHRYQDINFDSFPLVARAAFILGGTGQIGRSVAARLAQKDWSVAVGARGSSEFPSELARLGIPLETLDRSRPGELSQALGSSGFDVLVDVIPFTAEDAREVTALAGRVGSVVAVSSAAVYADDAGRSLDTQAEAFPEFPVPITERQRTVEPGDATYATRKAAMELAFLEGKLPVTIVRPGAIQGPGSRIPRELFFVKRFLDERRFVPLAYRGESRFHTTSVENLAEVVWLAAERPGKRVVNCGDPDPPSVLQIGRAVATALDAEWTEVLLPGPPQGSIGDTPWTGPRPFVLDMLEAELELRYRPVVTYERSVPNLGRWLVDKLRKQEWKDAFPAADEYMSSSFDYEAEDEFLRTLAPVGQST